MLDKSLILVTVSKYNLSWYSALVRCTSDDAGITIWNPLNKILQKVVPYTPFSFQEMYYCLRAAAILRQEMWKDFVPEINIMMSPFFSALLDRRMKCFQGGHLCGDVCLPWNDHWWMAWHRFFYVISLWTWTLKLWTLKNDICSLYNQYGGCRWPGIRLAPANPLQKMELTGQSISGVSWLNWD